MAAAVADYTPTVVAGEKIKKQNAGLTLELTKTKDILKTIGQSKRSGQIVIGFALETVDEINFAKKKLVEKNADLIVLNSLRDPLAGFGKDTNKVSIFDSSGQEYNYEAKSKELVANDIVELIIMKLHDKA